jgi:two-component system, oxyanion-binding sensor
VLAALVRAAVHAADFIEQPENRAEVAAILARPERMGVPAEVIQRALAGRLKIAPDGTIHEDKNYLLVGRDGAARPDPAQAAWLYAQMVRWGQASLSPAALEVAMAVFRPRLYDAALGRQAVDAGSALSDNGLGELGLVDAFAGPRFDPRDLGGYLASFGVLAREHS